MVNLYIYKFENSALGGKFELHEEDEKLYRNREEIFLTDTEFRILLLLVRRQNEAINKNEFLDEIWDMNSSAGESNVSVHVHSLRKKLGGSRNAFIRTEKHKKGYIFVAPVQKHKIAKNPSVTDIFDQDESDWEEERRNYEKSTAADDDEHAKIDAPLQFGVKEFIAAALGILVAGLMFSAGFYLQNCIADCFEENVYTALASIFFAILAGIAVFLECAYEFDKYGWRAVKMLPSIFLVAAASMFAALSVAGSQLPKKTGYAVIGGSFMLLCGAVGTCFLASFVLPDKPITAAKMQTQAAFSAFCKNVMIYFFPVYAIFGVLVFSLIHGSAATSKNAAYPVGLFVVLLVFIVISHFSTNVLLQNLLTPNDGEKYKYYGFFSGLIWFRQVFLFGTALLSVLYYFSVAVK